MISGASALQIKCGLFLWPSRYVEKLLQLMDVACMVCVELKLVNGEIHHERAMELNGVGIRDRRDEDRLRGLPHRGVGKLQ